MRRSLAVALVLFVAPFARAEDDDEVLHVDVPAIPRIQKGAVTGERVSAEFLVGTWISDAKAAARAAAPDLDPEALARIDQMPMPTTTYRFTKTNFEEIQTTAQGEATPFGTKGTWTLSKDGRMLTLVPTEGAERTLAVSKRGNQLAIDPGFMVMLFNKK